MGHICLTYKESFHVLCDNSTPLFLHAALYLEVSLFRWTSQNAFSCETAVYKWYCLQCCCAALHTVSFVHGEMHSDWFNGIEILEGRWQHGEKVGCCYPSGLEKTLCKWDIHVPLVTKGLICYGLMDSYLWNSINPCCYISANFYTFIFRFSNSNIDLEVEGVGTHSLTVIIRRWDPYS